MTEYRFKGKTVFCAINACVGSYLFNSNVEAFVSLHQPQLAGNVHH